MELRSEKLRCPSSAKPYGARRRPLTNTRVEFTDRPRKEAPEAPAAKPLPKEVGTEPLLLMGNAWIISASVTLPELSISARVTTRIGDDVSVSTRLILEPVTSTRSKDCVWAPAGSACIAKPAENATDNAKLNFDRLNMKKPL